MAQKGKEDTSHDCQLNRIAQHVAKNRPKVGHRLRWVYIVVLVYCTLSHIGFVLKDVNAVKTQC